jgi:hypothetical protein
MYFSSNIIRAIKSRRLRWAENLARMGKRRRAHRVLVGKHEERNHVKDQGVEGRIIL